MILKVFNIKNIDEAYFMFHDKLQNLQYIAFTFSLFTLTSSGFAQNNNVSLSVPSAPIPVAIYNSKTALVYELQITNNTNNLITPLVIDLINNNNVFIEYSGLELQHNIAFPSNNFTTNANLNISSVSNGANFFDGLDELSDLNTFDCFNEIGFQQFNGFISFNGLNGTNTLNGFNNINQINTSCSSIPAGQTAILYIWLAIPNNQPIPSTFTHQMAYMVNSNVNNVQVTPVTSTTNVQSSSSSISLTAPLNDGPWLAVGASNYTDNRRATVSDSNSGPLIPERFGINWFKLNSSGQNANDHTGNGDKNSDYYAYGQPVFASATGLVVASRSSFPDNPHPPIPQVFSNVLDAPGNFVEIQVDSNHFLLYSHLQPAVIVMPGQGVLAGQLIGFVGSSGDAATPHLQFSVVNSFNNTSPFLAQGVPYTYNQFTLLSFSPSDPQYYLNPYTPILTRSTQLTNQLPLSGMSVQFNSG